jgi:hypothetical protein
MQQHIEGLSQLAPDISVGSSTAPLIKDNELYPGQIVEQLMLNGTDDPDEASLRVSPLNGLHSGHGITDITDR